MYLAQLELQGFKSFANKTKIKFDSGITAIVGPNGCGKSNIVDALRWVLGEQRPTLLRSAAMTNVIFNGTDVKKALGLAEVSVTIHNNKGVLPTEFTDITMTRRLYRSGESEYLLNNKPCRLRDINDLFMDTGMGPNAYSVIELKMVDEILNDKNNDRRRLFEEAAGITKFKERKKQTLKKLSDTRADLQRLEDIMVEVRKKARSLQTQASRAERAHKYQEELEFLDKAVSHQEYLSIREELAPVLERIASASTAKEELERRLQRLEQNETEAHEQLIENEQVQNEIRKYAAKTGSEVQEVHTAIRIAEERIKNEEAVISRYEQDIYQAEKEIRDIRQDLKHAETQLISAEADLKNVHTEKEKAWDALQKSKEQVAETRKELDETSKRHSEASSRINELQNLQIRLESRIENAGEQEQRLLTESSESKEKIKAFALGQEEQQNRHDDLSAAYEEAEQALEKQRIGREQLSQQMNLQKDKIRSLQSRYDACRSEYQLLKNLAESSDSHPDAVRHLREHKSDFILLELVSDIFSGDDLYGAAIEAVLGDAANFVVVSDEEEASRAFSMLRKNEKGRVTIIPLNRLRAMDIDDVKKQPDNSSLLTHVRCEPRFDALKRLFFGNVVVAGTLDDAIRMAGPSGATAVTTEGDAALSNGFIYSGGAGSSSAGNKASTGNSSGTARAGAGSSSAGNKASTGNRSSAVSSGSGSVGAGSSVGTRIGLNEKIKVAEQQAKEAAIEVEKAEVELDELSGAYKKIDLQYYQQIVKEASNRLRKQETDAAANQSRLDFYEKNVRDLEARIQELNERAGEAERERLKIQPEIEKLSESLSSVVRTEVTLKSTLGEQEEILQRTQNRFNDITLQHQRAANESDNLKRDIQKSESDIQGIKDRLNRRAEQARAGKDLIIQIREELDTARDTLHALQVKKDGADKQYREAEEACSRQRGKINLIEESLKDTRRKRESNLELLHSLELAKSRLEMDLKIINDHIWEVYNLTMDQIDVTLPDDTDVSSAQETIFTLKERLKNIGEVNPLAISEYEEEKKRLDHFEEQIGDLERAEGQLIETIQEINGNALERFSKTFKEIRTNFRTVFHTLFDENDHCDLIMDESADDPLEAKIEIIANPRGKRPSVIEQLSGGEKTLTAIALLFAIYLVKPSPFCVMDEVDAPLDDPNILRFTRLLKKFSTETQFIVITHNKSTMDKSQMMYGVTMPETGISKLVAVRLDDVSA